MANNFPQRADEWNQYFEHATHPSIPFIIAALANGVPMEDITRGCFLFFYWLEKTHWEMLLGRNREARPMLIKYLFQLLKLFQSVEDVNYGRLTLRRTVPNELSAGSKKTYIFDADNGTLETITTHNRVDYVSTFPIHQSIIQILPIRSFQLAFGGIVSELTNLVDVGMNYHGREWHNMDRELFYENEMPMRALYKQGPFEPYIFTFQP